MQQFARRVLTTFVFSTLAGVLAALTTAPATAALIEFQATLLGTTAVPPNASPASGFIDVTLDDATNFLTVNMTFNGLIGGNATSAHIHCCRPPGIAIFTVLDFVGFPAATAGTYSHTFNLATDLINIGSVSGFITQLEAGLAYADIHNDGFLPGNEIRGQLNPVPLPAALPLFATGFGALGLLAWRRKRKAAARGLMRL